MTQQYERCAVPEHRLHRSHRLAQIFLKMVQSYPNLSQYLCQSVLSVQSVFWHSAAFVFLPTHRSKHSSKHYSTQQWDTNVLHMRIDNINIALFEIHLSKDKFIRYGS